MSRLICCFCLILCTAFSSCAQRKNTENALLWRISGKGLQQPSYLFGTIHLICSDDFIWTGAMKQALESSNKVCFELDLDDPSMFSEIANGMADTSEPTLREQLNTEEYSRLKRFFKDSLHVELSSVEGLGSTTLSMLLIARILSCDNQVSYEQKIMGFVSDKNKEIVGLEQVSEQLSVLDSISSDTGGKELLTLIDSLPHYRAEYGKMVSYYKQQNLQALCEWIKSSDMPLEPMDALLDDRNKKWIARMQSMMTNSSLFFAVGAAHLCGPNGVIALLKNAGYTLTPVR